MPYFKLMRAINLYVVVDWQDDREIERREEGGGSRGGGKRKEQTASGRSEEKEESYGERGEEETGKRENK